MYGNAKLKEDDALVSIIKEKELNIETIKMRETLSRYGLMFQDEFSDGEVQVLIDIYNVRNHFVHGYKSDDDLLSDSENIVKKIGTVWEKISNLAVSIFGTDLIKANKPKKKYSEEELEKVLTSEVRTKIKSIKSELEMFSLNNYMYPIPNYMSAYGVTGEKCPRCDAYEFSLDEPSPTLDALLVTGVYGQRINFSDLYKLKVWSGLTKREYAIAKKLKSSYDKTHFRYQFVINLLDYKSESATSVDELTEILRYGLDGDVNTLSRLEWRVTSIKIRMRKKTKLTKRISMFPVIGTVARFDISKLIVETSW